MKSDLYAAKLSVKREQAINNQLIKFNEEQNSTEEESQILADPPTSTAPGENNNVGVETNQLAATEDEEVLPPGPELVVPLRKCKYEIATRGSCPFTQRPCKFSHDITSEDKQRYDREDFCEKEFLGGKDSCPAGTTCRKNHKFDYDKLAHGPCFHELRRKNSCNHRACNYSHQIPQSLRGNSDLIATVSGAMRKYKENCTLKNQKDVCVDEFYGGKNSCKSRDCKKDKDHNLDWTKVKRGLCLFEFFKKGSCTRRNRCIFNHQIPIECLGDREITKTVLNSINRFSNKTRIAEVLGDEVVQTAIATSDITRQTERPQAHRPQNKDNVNGYTNPWTHTNIENSFCPQQSSSASNPHISKHIVPQQQQYPCTTGTYNPVPSPVPPPPVLQNQHIPSLMDIYHITPFLSNIIKEMVSKESQKFFVPNPQPIIST